MRKLMKRAGRTTNWGEWSGDDHGGDDDLGDEEDEGGAVVGDADDDGDGCPWKGGSGFASWQHFSSHNWQQCHVQFLH